MTSWGKDGDKSSVLCPRYPGLWGSRGAARPVPGTASLPGLEQQPGHGAQLRPQAWHRASSALRMHRISQAEKARGGTCGFLGAAWPSRSSNDSCSGKFREPLLPILIQPQISRKCSTTSILRRIHISSVSKIYVLWFCLTNFFFLMVWNHKMFLIFIFREL